jgi:hypothetical protein
MKLQDKTFVMMAVVLCGAVAVSVVQDADAHITFNIPAPNTVTNYQNKTIVFTVGETKEPAFTDEPHNFELTLRDFNTRHTIPNAFRDYTAGNAQSLWVDAYFFPKGITPALNGSAHCNAAVLKTSPSDTTYTCGPVSGYTAVKKGQLVRAIFGSAGQYQADNQWYTEAGRTVYHIYGKVNYFNDTMIPVNVWADGAAIKSGTNGATHIVPASGGFGLSDRTTQFWPPNTQQPENIRDAMVKDRNFLQELRTGINQIIASITGTAIPVQSGYQ